MKWIYESEGDNMIKGEEIQKVRCRLRYVILSLSFMLLYSCATTMEVTPKVEQINNIDFRIGGRVICEGNREYLPRIINDEPVSDSKLTFQYTYNALYGKHDIPEVIALFNPLNIVGFPTGENSLTIIGKLDILKGKKVIKSYTATCVLEKTRNLFSEGETFSEIRKKGLIAVRDNIEVQIYQDRDFLSKLKSAD